MNAKMFKNFFLIQQIQLKTEFLAATDSPVCPEVYSEPCQTSKMEYFAKVVKGWNPLTTFSKTLHPRCLPGL